MLLPKNQNTNAVTHNRLSDGVFGINYSVLGSLMLSKDLKLHWEPCNTVSKATWFQTIESEKMYRLLTMP